MTPVLASVVIPAHNAEAVLARQLDALTNQVGAGDFEVIVVANRCTDGTAETAARFADRLRIDVIHANEMASASYARNIGAEHATGEFLLFCDADDEVQEAWVAQMVEPLRTARADFVGGHIEVDGRGMPDWLYRWRTPNPSKRSRVTSGKPSIITASFAITAQAFRAVGGFDTDFRGAGFEDNDITNRLWQAGFRAGRATDAIVLYDARKNFRSILSKARGYELGRAIYEEKWEGVSQPTSLRLTAKRIVTQNRKLSARLGSYRPKVVLLVTYFHLALLITNRRVHRSRRSISRTTTPLADPPDTFTGCAHLDAPVIGGLGFATPNRNHANLLSNVFIIEAGTLAVIWDMLPMGGTFVDVGANVGTMSVAAALTSGSAGRVIAFEPQQQVAALLSANARRHGVDERVTVRHEAVGASAGTHEMFFHVNSLVSGAIEAPQRFHPGRSQRRVVSMVVLDDVIDTPVSMLKVDVEGFEVEVFEGCRRILQDNRDIIVLFEVNYVLAEHMNRPLEKVFGFFPRSEWATYVINESAAIDGSGRPVLEVIDGVLDEKRRSAKPPYTNVLAVRRSGPPVPEHLFGRRTTM